jgi:undecaprenyl phosphate N,N'-diacetylbacillosamine 1-phosphate transferase
MYKKIFKRIFDLLVSLLLSILFLPIFIVVMMMIKADSRGPVFFIQERIGYKGRIFRILKFRTMTHKHRTNDHNEVMLDNPEITKIGRYLRRFKIDELPQLLNVVVGDMSIVGPRPALPSHLEMYSKDVRKRLDVRPGLTGLAQINGNILLSWPERWGYDQHYVENLSLLMDLKIILKTFRIIVQGEKIGL